MNFLKLYGFKLISKLSLLTDKEKNLSDYTGCAIKFSKDKKFIFTCIRGLDSISVFSINPKLELIKHISCFGKTPRDILVIDNYLLCANQNSNSITVFDINKNTGELCYKSTFNIPHPACIINL